MFNREPGSGERRWKIDGINYKQSQEPHEEAARKAVEAWKGTPQGLATALDEPPYMVKQALEELRSNTAVVQQTDDGKL